MAREYECPAVFRDAIRMEDLDVRLRYSVTVSEPPGEIAIEILRITRATGEQIHGPSLVNEADLQQRCYNDYANRDEDDL